MKNIVLLLLVSLQISVYGQLDSLRIHRLSGPDYSKTNYPKGDGLTYNPYVGETIAGYTVADGWRRDSVNGGFNKELYDNPYVDEVRFEKQYGDQLSSYRYKEGKRYTGAIADTLTVSFTPNKIAGYLYGKPYYESKDLTVLFRANCVDGLVQGRGVLCGIVPQYGIYNNLLLSECTFEDGEIVGVCTHYNLNSIDFTIYNGKIKCLEAEHDYFELKKLLETTAITYVKGSTEWTKQTTTDRNGRTKTEYPEKTTTNKK